MPQIDRRIPTLDGWRGLAILSVLAAHAGTSFYAQDEYYKHAIRYGVIGIDFFFGLSGLLITTLLLREAERNGTVSLKSFYIRRTFRILPPCFAFIAVCAALHLMRTRWELASAILFFRNYLPDGLGTMNTAHLWSLAIEEHFYLLWPGLLVLFGVSRGPVTAISLAVACALWRVADLHFHLVSRIFPQAPIGSRTDLRLDSLLWGCALAFALQNPAMRTWMREHFRFGVWLLFAAAYIACVALKPPMEYMFTAMLVPLLLIGTVLSPQWILSQFLDLSPLRWVGRISYSLYLWQQPFLAGPWEPPGPLGMLQYWPFNIIAALLCAVASYYLLEKPLIRIGHQLAGRVGAARPMPLERQVAGASA